jgi:hypothetical protein
MSNLLYRTQRRISDDPFFGLALSVGIITTLTALALYGYLGTFSRYVSDDYCLSAFFLTDDFWSAMVQRYNVSSSRYTNILFIGLADHLFGWHNVAILPALMLSLFVLGMYQFLREIFEVMPWGGNRWVIFFLSLLVAYFSITQAPDLYQTLYWRAGMTSHFAPVVFMPFWSAFLLRQVRNAGARLPSIWIQSMCFSIPFVIGGLSEPPTALIITILGLALVAGWRWSGAHNRQSILVLLSWSLAGAMAALLMMGLAPANSLRMQTPPPPLLELVSRIVYYPSLFIADTLRTLPTPTLVSIVVPAVLFYVQYVHRPQGLSQMTRNRLGLLMFIVLILAYLLIAASFAPSVYGQSYPVPRARFVARVMMTLALMLEGALIGSLAAQVRANALQPAVMHTLAIVLLAILALYPLRTVWRTLEEIPVYQQSADVWDAREAEIFAMKAQGQQDLVVRFLPEVPIQDLGDHTGYRLNRCAAALYGVNSIVAVPMEDE